MNHKNLVTIKAFLLALESLDQLPEDLQTDLCTITEDLLKSADVQDLAERYQPLNQRYLAALKDLSKAQVAESDLFEQSDVSVGVVEQKAAPAQPVKHLIEELGWTREQAAEIRYRLASFSEDWEAPGMEVYDDI